MTNSIFTLLLKTLSAPFERLSMVAQIASELSVAFKVNLWFS